MAATEPGTANWPASGARAAAANSARSATRRHPRRDRDRTKDVKHTRPYRGADGRLERPPARALDGHAAGEALSGCQRYAAHTLRVQLCPYLNEDSTLLTDTQQGIYRWQLRRKAYFDDAAAHGHYCAEPCRRVLIGHRRRRPAVWIGLDA
jgi:hypothetical protein